MTHTLAVGGGIFVATYLAIGLERRIGIDKTVVAMLGAVAMLFTILRRVGSHHAGSIFNESVDFDVIFLLGGMMVIVNVLRDTGLFQYVAVLCAKAGRGFPLVVLSLLVVATAVVSAFLDNVTTVLLMAPVMLLVAAELRLDPVPFLLPAILASNIGGTATLIGDPPNILVGSYAGLDFMAFIRVLTPFVIVLMAVFLGVVLLSLRGTMTVKAEERARIMDMDPRRALKDMRLLRRALVVTGLTLAGFFLHGQLSLEPGVVAVAGAALMLAVTGVNVEKSLAEVEWTTLAFFMGLFIVVHGAVEAGLMGRVAEALRAAVESSSRPTLAAPLAVLWISGLAAGFTNNVSFTAAALPVVKQLAASLHLVGLQAAPLWWALALGACLGGNMTPVGAAANLVVLNIAARNQKEISLGRFLRWGVPCALGSLVLASGYVLLLVRWTN